MDDHVLACEGRLDRIRVGHVGPDALDALYGTPVESAEFVSSYRLQVLSKYAANQAAHAGDQYFFHGWYAILQERIGVAPGLRMRPQV